MRMNQETQAMKVMGIDLFDALVVPRIFSQSKASPAAKCGRATISVKFADSKSAIILERVRSADRTPAISSGYTIFPTEHSTRSLPLQIGSESCRERVCQYV